MIIEIEEARDTLSLEAAWIAITHHYTNIMRAYLLLQRAKLSVDKRVRAHLVREAEELISGSMESLNGGLVMQDFASALDDLIDELKR